MSYCRFSSDDFQCDVYTYADCMGGYTTFIAECRYDLCKPLPPEVPMDDIKVWYKRERKVRRIIDKSKLVKIGLPCDGESYNDATAEECANRLESLKNMGYRVPRYAIDSLREDALDEES